MNVKEIVKQWLKDNGYDGLFLDNNCPDGDENCGCSIDDFAPCGEGPLPECEPAYRKDGLSYPSDYKEKMSE